MSLALPGRLKMRDEDVSDGDSTASQREKFNGEPAQHAQHVQHGAAGAASLGRTVENKAIQLSKKQSTVTSSVAIALTCCFSVGVQGGCAIHHITHHLKVFSSLFLPPYMPHSTHRSFCTERFHSQLPQDEGRGRQGASCSSSAHWTAERAV